MKLGHILRVVRPTDNLAAIVEMYVAGLGFTVIAQFVDHEGLDGAILGHPQQPYHFAFISQHGHRAGSAPTKDHLLVFSCQPKTAPPHGPLIADATEPVMWGRV